MRWIFQMDKNIKKASDIEMSKKEIDSNESNAVTANFMANTWLLFNQKYLNVCVRNWRRPNIQALIYVIATWNRFLKSSKKSWELFK